MFSFHLISYSLPYFHTDLHYTKKKVRKESLLHT